MASQSAKPAIRATKAQPPAPPVQQATAAKSSIPPVDMPLDEELEEEGNETYEAMMQQLPGWLSSMVVHIAILLGAALWLVEIPEKPKENSLVVSPSESLDDEEEVFDDQVSLDEQEIPDDPAETEVMPVEVPLADTTLDSDFNDPTVKEAIPEFNALAIADYGTLIQTKPTSATKHVLGKDFSGRGKTQRQRSVGGPDGSSGKSELAVENALRWIATHQGPSGNWDFKLSKCLASCSCKNHGKSGAKNGATGLALLPFLGAGYTHTQGKYKANIWKGLNFLISNMKADSDSRGGDLTDGMGRMYSHGLASIALAEAYGMTEDSRLRSPARSALRFIVHAQHPAGGWRYRPGEAGDTSVVGWQIMALKSGVMSGVMDKKDLKPVFQKADDFLTGVSSDSGAFYGYLKPGRLTGPTAVGHLSKMYLGLGKENPGLQRGADWLGSKGPMQENMYYSYYATQVIHHLGGQRWTEWNKEMRDPLVKKQVKDGHARGSWMFSGGDHGYRDGGRLYATAMAAMMLEVYYRHMPLYKDKTAKAVDLEAWDLD
jgi:hypothetical protein